MLVVIFVGPPHSELTFFGPVKPGPNLLDVLLGLRLERTVGRGVGVGETHE
jgi:hypothetical protein